MKKLLAGIAILSFIPLFGVQGSAQFDPLEQTCDGVTTSEICNERVTDPDAENPLTSSDGTLNRVANLLALVSAVIAVIIIVIAGITMTVSSGDSTKIQNSRNAIIYAVVGLVVIALARGIIALIVNLV